MEKAKTRLSHLWNRIVARLHCGSYFGAVLLEVALDFRKELHSARATAKVARVSLLSNEFRRCFGKNLGV